MARDKARLRVPVGPEDHVMGRADAPVTLVEYGDFECPYCGRAYPIIKRVQQRMGNRLRFVFRHFPLAESHPHATAAAEAAEAAGLQGKFWQMHDALFEHQQALSATDILSYARALHIDIAALGAALEDGKVAERVRANFMSGVRSGVNGTPTFFIDEDRFDGDWTDANELIAELEKAAARR